MKKYIGLTQNDMDPSPEVRESLSKIVEYVFKLAEYVLVLGVFCFLSITTKNWAVIAVAFVLGASLFVYIFSMLSGIQFILWRNAPLRWQRATLFVLDSAIYFALYAVLYVALWTIVTTMLKGVGV